MQIHLAVAIVSLFLHFQLDSLRLQFAALSRTSCRAHERQQRDEVSLTHGFTGTDMTEAAV